MAMMPYGWEGNRRSGFALAMRHRLQWFIHLRAQCLMEGRWAPRLHSSQEYGTLYLTYSTVHCIYNWAIDGLQPVLTNALTVAWQKANVPHSQLGLIFVPMAMSPYLGVTSNMVKPDKYNIIVIFQWHGPRPRLFDIRGTYLWTVNLSKVITCQLNSQKSNP